MTIENYSGKDCEEIIALWKKTLPYLVINKKLFMQKILLDPNFDAKGFFVAREEGKITGFVNAVYKKVPLCDGASLDEEKGYLAGFVLEGASDEAKNELLERAEQYLVEKGKTTLSTAYYPYFVQGADVKNCPKTAELFKARGYSAKESVSKILMLDEYKSSERLVQKKEKLQKEGIRVMSLTDEYVPLLLTLENDFLRPSWLVEYKIRIADMDFDRVKIAVRGREVLGACIFKDPGSNDERFGPFGVSPKCRGMGIGGVILDEILTEMKSRGLKYAWMQWASGHEASEVLYDRVGFKNKDTYLEFEKTF